MADNYLEKKYEEYRSGKNAGTATGYGKKKANTLHKTRRVFVTEGTGDLGRVIVKAFRRAGHRVAFGGTDEEAGKLLAEKTGTTFCHANINDKVSLANCLQHMLEDWGDLDILVNNTSDSKVTPIIETGIEDFEQNLSANLLSTFVTSRLLALHRRSQSEANPYGRIINLSANSVTTGGLLSLTSALAASLTEWQITVNSITTGEVSAFGEDIARMCLFLCQEENGSINGENITIGVGISKRIY